MAGKNDPKKKKRVSQLYPHEQELNRAIRKRQKEEKRLVEAGNKPGRAVNSIFSFLKNSDLVEGENFGYDRSLGRSFIDQQSIDTLYDFWGGTQTVLFISTLAKGGVEVMAKKASPAPKKCYNSGDRIISVKEPGKYGTVVSEPVQVAETHSAVTVIWDGEKEEDSVFSGDIAPAKDIYLSLGNPLSKDIPAFLKQHDHVHLPQLNEYLESCTNFPKRSLLSKQKKSLIIEGLILNISPKNFYLLFDRNESSYSLVDPADGNILRAILDFLNEEVKLFGVKLEGVNGKGFKDFTEPQKNRFISTTILFTKIVPSFEGCNSIDTLTLNEFLHPYLER